MRPENKLRLDRAELYVCEMLREGQVLSRGELETISQDYQVHPSSLFMRLAYNARRFRERTGMRVDIFDYRGRAVFAQTGVSLDQTNFTVIKQRIDERIARGFRLKFNKEK